LLDDPNHRRHAAEVLARARPDHPRLVPALLEQVRSPSVSDRHAAVQLLGQLGPPAKAAVPALAGLLRDPSLSQPATQALAQIGPAGLPPLLEALAGGRPARYPLIFLGQLGPDALPAVPKLIELLGDPSARA